MIAELVLGPPPFPNPLSPGDARYTAYRPSIAALRAAGATRVFSEKISGVRADRTQLRKLMATLREGDTVLVTRLDRLARSTRDQETEAGGG